MIFGRESKNLQTKYAFDNVAVRFKIFGRPFRLKGTIPLLNNI